MGKNLWFVRKGALENRKGLATGHACPNPITEVGDAYMKQCNEKCGLTKFQEHLGQLRIENYLLVVNHLDGLIRRSWPLARTEGRSFGARVVRQSEADDVIQIAQGIASIITAVVDTIPMVRRWADVLAQTE